MLEVGHVTKLKDNFATVKIGRHSACGACGKCGMTEKQKYVEFYTVNSISAQVGDKVEIDIKDTNVTRLAIYAYFLPLVLGVLMFFIGVWSNMRDWGNLIMFVLGFAIAILVLSIIDKRKKHSWTTSPELIRIIDEEGDNDE